MSEFDDSVFSALDAFENAYYKPSARASSAGAQQAENQVRWFRILCFTAHVPPFVYLLRQ